MLSFDIPGYGALRIKHLVLDLNGTLTVDGELVDGVAERLRELSEHVAIHVTTADTRGQAAEAVRDLPVQLVVTPEENPHEFKLGIIRNLDGDYCIAIGNGRIDRLMLAAARLGITVILPEGAGTEAVAAADVVCTDIRHALDLLLKPERLIATLRS